jgi:hypothetical protein
MFIPTVDPELVRVAEPVTLQVPARVMNGLKVPDAVTLSALPVAVKVTLPGTVTGAALPQVTVKL